MGLKFSCSRSAVGTPPFAAIQLDFLDSRFRQVGSVGRETCKLDSFSIVTRIPGFRELQPPNLNLKPYLPLIFLIPLFRYHLLFHYPDTLNLKPETLNPKP